MRPFRKSHQDGTDGAGERHGPVFAEPVADRADDELNRAVGHRIGGDHHRRDADGGMQIGRHLRQQRVHDPDLRLAGKAGDRQEDDRARRRRVRSRRKDRVRWGHVDTLGGSGFLPHALIGLKWLLGKQSEIFGATTRHDRKQIPAKRG